MEVNMAKVLLVGMVSGLIACVSIVAFLVPDGPIEDAVRMAPEAPRPPASCPHHGVTMLAEDGREYLVREGEALADSMAREMEHGYQLAGQEDEPAAPDGNCYNSGLDPNKVPPEGKAACECYKITKCAPHSSETRECKRYCHKDKCDCCAI